jgi:hypothetical protein
MQVSAASVAGLSHTVIPQWRRRSMRQVPWLEVGEVRQSFIAITGGLLAANRLLRNCHQLLRHSWNSPRAGAARRVALRQRYAAAVGYREGIGVSCSHRLQRDDSDARGIHCATDI